MGLDISAYSRLVPTEAGAVRISAGIIEWVERHFPGRSEGLVPGVFSFGGVLTFRAGTYSGYGRWRDQLAHAVYAHSAEIVWARSSGPFFELINFADNEGVIGPVVARKLANDFAEHHRRIGGATNDTCFMQSYCCWRKAFNLAADAGVVIFH